jgi:hypothetical protein
MYSSMDADADVEDIGLDAKRIDDVVAAYDAVEDHEDRAEDYFNDFSGNKENNVVDGEAQNSFIDDDDDVCGTPPLPPTDVFAPLSSNYKKHFDDYNIVSFLVKQEVANIFIASITNHVVYKPS